MIVVDLEMGGRSCVLQQEERFSFSAKLVVQKRQNTSDSSELCAANVFNTMRRERARHYARCMKTSSPTFTAASMVLVAREVYQSSTFFTPMHTTKLMRSLASFRVCVIPTRVSCPTLLWATGILDTLGSMRTRQIQMVSRIDPEKLSENHGDSGDH